MQSIMQDKKECYVCGSTTYLESHHCILGKNRKNAERFGLKVWLCYNHHRGTYGVHGKYGNILQNRLKEDAQKRFEEEFKDKDFLEIFKINYL